MHANTNTPAQFSALFTSADLPVIERNDLAIANHRRICMALLARDSDQLRHGLANPDLEDALIQIIESVSTYRGHLKSSLELAEVACSRLALIIEEWEGA